MTTDSQPAEPQASLDPVLKLRSGGDVGRFAAVGTGVGLEIRNNELHVTIVKVRPWETGVLGSATVPDFRNRPAGEWGTELLAFLRKMSAGHIAANVLLPRTEVIVRQVHLPGVSNRDLAAAVQLQIDSLHPFSDDEVYYTSAKIGKTPYVLVGIARRETIDAYSTLFAEAGIKVASFTFSAAVVYSAARLITVPPESFVALHEVRDGVEVYGESTAKPLYSATLPVNAEHAAAVAGAELRLEPGVEPLRLSDILPKPSLFPPNHDPQTGALEHQAMSYATALAGACPWMSIEGNLLPADKRRASSRVRLVPTVTLGVVLVVLLAMLAFQSSYADRRYLGVLQHEIRRFEPNARKVETLDRATMTMRARSQSLDDFRRRAKLDMDTLAEITKSIPPPGWVTALEMDRNTVQIAGEVEQAAALLSVFDRSTLFDRTEFTMPINRSAAGEIFRIRTQRVTPPVNGAATRAPAKPVTEGSAK
jgi:Tfp pilus assembly protein PilN